MSQSFELIVFAETDIREEKTQYGVMTRCDGIGEPPFPHKYHLKPGIWDGEKTSTEELHDTLEDLMESIKTSIASYGVETQMTLSYYIPRYAVLTFTPALEESEATFTGVRRRGLLEKERLVFYENY